MQDRDLVYLVDYGHFAGEVFQTLVGEGGKPKLKYRVVAYRHNLACFLSREFDEKLDAIKYIEDEAERINNKIERYYGSKHGTTRAKAA